MKLFGGSEDSREGDTTRALKRREKMQRIPDKARTLLDWLEKELDWVLPAQRPCSVEALAKVAEQLRAALDAHVPRPYSGKAAILVNSTKAHKILGDSAFWQSHLGGIEHQVCGTSHHEVFRDQIMETARFVSRSLRPAKSGGASIPEKKQAK